MIAGIVAIDAINGDSSVIIVVAHPRSDCRGSHHRRRLDHRFALFDIVFALVLATHALSSETLFIFDFDKKFPLKFGSDATLKEVIG